jgi:hypothetical protein
MWHTNKNSGFPEFFGQNDNFLCRISEMYLNVSCYFFVELETACHFVLFHCLSSRLFSFEEDFPTALCGIVFRRQGQQSFPALDGGEGLFHLLPGFFFQRLRERLVSVPGRIPG